MARHLFGGVEFHVLNLIGVGPHEAANDILEVLRPPLLGRSLVGIWSNLAVPTVA